MRVTKEAMKESTMLMFQRMDKTLVMSDRYKILLTYVWTAVCLGNSLKQKIAYIHCI